jgi:hypothetical protein
MNNISPSKYTFSNKYFKTSIIKEVACFSTKQKDWEMDCPRSWVMLETLEMDPMEMLKFSKSMTK